MRTDAPRNAAKNYISTDAPKNPAKTVQTISNKTGTPNKNNS